MSDPMTETYYAEMEAARNRSEAAYFKARRAFDSPANRHLFRAGFERAFDILWSNELGRDTLHGVKQLPQSLRDPAEVLKRGEELLDTTFAHSANPNQEPK
jgi:hypothetical protein